MTGSNRRPPRCKRDALPLSQILLYSSTWTRTRDRVINSHLLYQLKHRGICVPRRVSSVTGIEPSLTWVVAPILFSLACYRIHHTVKRGRVLYGRGGGGGLFQCPATQVASLRPTTLRRQLLWSLLMPIESCGGTFDRLLRRQLNHQGDYRS